MKAYTFLYFLLLTGLIISCSEKKVVPEAVVKGKITVADSIDSSKDYSGIGVTIISRDSAGAEADTLFHEMTNREGSFSGIALFQRRGQYPVHVTRNGNTLGQFGVILADGDTVTINGELPGLQQTLSLRSVEHDALETYRRLERNVQRILAYAQAGALRGDTLETELNKWSNLFWEVYEKNSGTLAGEMAAEESIRLLSGWNNQEMMKKIRRVHDNDELADMGATFGKDYLAEDEGLVPALAYLDSLQTMTQKEEVRKQISMEQIKLLYDSARVEEAKVKLTEFQEEFRGREARKWAETISFDLNYLSKGNAIPSFSFTDNGNTVSRDSLIGTPYILEITTLANRLYQEQFDRTVVIHSLYKTYGLQVVTLPLDDSQVTVDAFFEERVKPWPVASAGSFDREELLEKFNIRVVPTRFLIDREGRIVRKYVGREYSDVIQGIQTLMTKSEPAS